MIRFALLCLVATFVAASAAAADLNRAALEARAAKECGGPARIDPSAIAEGRIDGDGRADFVLDWAGVSCAPGSDMPGLGAGNCGAAMCAFEVFLSAAGARPDRSQAFLGFGPRIEPVGDGLADVVAQAIAPACPGGARECVLRLRWNGSALEPVP